MAINGKDRFEPTRSIVRQIADRASGQRREPGTLRQPLVREVLPQKIDSSFIQHLALAVSFDDCLRALRAGDHPWVGADERISSDALTAFNRFEQA